MAEENTQPVGGVIKSLSNLLRRHLDAVFAEAGLTELTGTQGMVLHYLISCGDQCVTQRDVEQYFNIRGATSTKLFQRMEAAGLIERTVLRRDQRKKRLLPTQKGRQLHARFSSHLLYTDQLLVQNISQEELEVFLRVCAKMQQNLL